MISLIRATFAVPVRALAQAYESTVGGADDMVMVLFGTVLILAGIWILLSVQTSGGAQ